MSPTPKFRTRLLPLLAALTLAAGALPAQAADLPHVSLNPAAALVSGCETVTLDVEIADVVDLYGADVVLNFDPQRLEVLDADPITAGVQAEVGPLLHAPMVVVNRADNTAGTYQFAATQLNPAPPVNGSGRLLRLTLRARTQGAAPVTVAASTLANRDGIALEHTRAGATITQTPAAAAPTLNTLNPSQALAGAAAFTLTAAGTQFTPTSVLRWDGQALATTFISESELQAAIPTDHLGAVGVFPIDVEQASVCARSAPLDFIVIQPNRAPLGLGEVYTATESTQLTVAAPGVLTNDSDPDGDALTAAVATAPLHGVLILQADGGFQYLPEAGFVGQDSFSYRASDGALTSSPLAVSLRVLPGIPISGPKPTFLPFIVLFRP